MSFLTKNKTDSSYQKKNRVFAKKTQLAKNTAKNNFDEFCKSSYEGRSAEEVIDEMVLIQKKDLDTVYDTLQEWVNYNLERVSRISTRHYFSNLKTFLKYRGLKITREEYHDNIIIPKPNEEELVSCSTEDIKRILEVSNFKHKGLWLGMLSSGMRPVEILHIRVKDCDFNKKRIVVHVPAEWTKLKRAKTTFFSKEAGRFIIQISKDKNPEDFIFGSSTIGLDIGFKRAYARAGFTDKYEHNRRNKITPMSLRSYFITKISRKDPNLAKKYAGQKGYLLQYDRLTEDEKLEKYIEFEPELLIFENKPESDEIKELKKDMAELKSSNERNEEILQYVSEGLITITPGDDKSDYGYDTRKLNKFRKEQDEAYIKDHEEYMKKKKMVSK